MSADGGGRHDRPSDTLDSPRCRIGLANRTNVQYPDNLDAIALDVRPMRSRARRPRGCRARRPRPASSPNAAAPLAGSTTPATIVGRAVGVAGPGPRGARSSGTAASRVEHRVEPRRASARGPRRARGRRARARGRSPRTGSAVPATAIAARARAQSRGTAASSVGAHVGGAAPRAPARVGGSRCRWRSVWRTTPIWVETWKSTSPPRADDQLGRAAADVDHEQRRPASVARARSRRGRSAAPPRRRSACARRARSARARARANSAPLAASRTAEVITAARALAPSASIASA